MEQITKYKAVDGKEFLQKSECIKYEQLISDVDAVMSQLPHRPDDTTFTNGAGFIQHSKEVFDKVRLELLAIIKQRIDHTWIDQTINDETVHPSWVGRMISEHGIRPLQEAWHRFECMDKDLKEYGQPYFAKNPSEVSGGQIN